MGIVIADLIKIEKHGAGHAFTATPIKSCLLS
jgi:hypothetical protein